MTDSTLAGFRSIQGLPVLRKLNRSEEQRLQSQLGLKGGGFTIECFDALLERRSLTNCQRSTIPTEFLEPEPVSFDPNADRVNRTPTSVSALSQLPDLSVDDDPMPETTPVPEQEISQLLPVLPRKVGEDEVNAVNARDLHRFLGVGKDFSNWIKDRIESFGFTENKDFEVFANSGVNPQGGRPAKDYALALDMAKELAMVERTQRGKQARLYFIDVEKRYRSAAATATRAGRLMSTEEMLMESARLLFDHKRQLDTLADQNRTMARQQSTLAADLQQLRSTVTQPMIDVYSGVALAGDNVSMMWVCKRLGVRRLALFEHLRVRKVLMTGGSKHNYPYAIWERCFATTTVPVNKGDRMATATKVTPEGIKWLCRCYHRGEFDAFLNRPRRDQLDLSRTPGDDELDAVDL